MSCVSVEVSLKAFLKCRVTDSRGWDGHKLTVTMTFYGKNLTAHSCKHLWKILRKIIQGILMTAFIKTVNGQL